MRAIWRFLQRFSWPFGLTGGVFALSVPFLPSWNISLPVALAVTAIAIAVLITMWGYVIDNIQETTESKIIVDQILQNGRLFLIRKTDRLGHYMGAQIFISESGFELFIGTARVVNVQQNGMIQLLMENLDIEQGVDQQLVENRDDIKRRLIIKPAVILDNSIAEG